MGSGEGLIMRNFVVRVIKSRRLGWPGHEARMEEGINIDTFKYHVSCTDGKTSVRINLLFNLYFHRRPIQQLCVSFL